MVIREGNELSELMSGGVCFHCEEPVSPPFVHWHGTGDGGELFNLAFHPKCALHFGLRFMRDVHELDLDEGLSFGKRRT
jgi:hypothetical protein